MKRPFLYTHSLKQPDANKSNADNEKEDNAKNKDDIVTETDSENISATENSEKKQKVFYWLKRCCRENASKTRFPLKEQPPFPTYPPQSGDGQEELHPLPEIPLWSTLQAKFAISSLLILVAVLVLLNIYPINTTRGLLFHSKEVAMKRDLVVISAVLMELENLSSSSVQRVMTVLETEGLSRVVITDPVGKILLDSQENYQTEGNYALVQEVYLALTGHDVMNTYYSSGKIYSSAAVPIIYGDNTIGAVYLHEEDLIQGTLLTSLQDNIYAISWVAIGFATLLYVIFSIFFTNRIRSMLAAIRIVGAGDYGHRLHPQGRDEMSYLAMEINILTDRLQTTEEVRRRFVSDASHELRTPLASIRLLADSILHNEAIDPAMTREFVSDICAESERLSRITERLLSLSKLDNLPPPVAEPVAVYTVLERILQNLELVAEDANITMEYTPEECHYLLCTPDKLHQICYNIIENAVKYTPSGGCVQIETKISGEELLIEISDNGLGIPPEDLPKIFNRFYRVDDARSREAGGTGLGLAIVRDTVRSYGGWVEAKNNPQQGTLFIVGLPKTNCPHPEHVGWSAKELTRKNRHLRSGNGQEDEKLNQEEQ